MCDGGGCRENARHSRPRIGARTGFRLLDNSRAETVLNIVWKQRFLAATLVGLLIVTIVSAQEPMSPKSALEGRTSSTTAPVIEISLHSRAGSDGRGPLNPMREVVYKTVDNVPLKLWIMTPVGWKASDKRLLIMYSYGSGWKGNSQPKDIMELKYYNRVWTKGHRFGHDFGAVTVGFDYRGGKPGGIPNQISDAKSATRWALAHAAELGIDPDRLVVAGDSSGGHLATSAAWFPGAFDDPADGAPTPIRAKAVLSFCSVLSRDTKSESPAHNIKPDSPPTLLMFGDQDGWKKTADTFAAEAAKVGAPVHFEVYPGASHDFHVGGPYFDQTMALAGRFMQACGVVPWLGVCLPGERLELNGLGDVVAMAVRTPLKGTPGKVNFTATTGGRIEGAAFVSDGVPGVYPVAGIDSAAGEKSRRAGWVRVPVVLDSGRAGVAVEPEGPWREVLQPNAIGGQEWELPSGSVGGLKLSWTASAPGRYLVYGVRSSPGKGAEQIAISATIGDGPPISGQWDQVASREAGGHLLLSQALETKQDQKVTIRVGCGKNSNRPLRLDAVLLVPVTTGEIP